MFRTVTSRILVFFIGLLAGILLEARLFHPVRVANAVTAAAGSAAFPPADGPITASEDTQGNEEEGPRLVVDQPKFDFGEAEQGSKITHTFKLQNTGKSPLSITAVRPSCGCTVTKLSSETIEPGTSAELLAVLDLRNLSGPQTREILIQTNDPKLPYAKLAMVGQATTRIVLEPAVLELGRLTADVPASGSAQVRAVDGLSFNVTDTRTSDANVLAAVEEVEAGRNFRVNVTLKGPLKDGPYQGWVRLLTDNEEGYDQIPLVLRAHVGAGGGIQIGDILEISGPTLDGKAADLASFRGQPAMVVFWASWCGHCQQEIPRLVEMYNSYHERGLQIVGVNMDRETAKATNACDRWKVPWPNIHFSESGKAVAPNPLGERYEINGIPAVILVSPNGKVVTTKARGVELEKEIGRFLGSAASADVAQTR